MKPKASREKTAVSRASDHLFFSEGAMEGTVCFTGEHSILLKSYEKICLSQSGW
jgi:hypothetical protein